MNPELWRLDRYADFLGERRRLIAEAINKHLQILMTEAARSPGSR